MSESDNRKERRPHPPSEENAADASPNEEQLLQAVQQYMRELESGRRPSRQEWLARYPQLQPALGDCLDGVNLMH